MSSPTAPRRGVAILVVLVVISITFALSYAVMRSQGTAILIQQNSSLTASARQAAMIGLEAALQKINTADWSGVDSSTGNSLGSYAGYVVTYTAGDSTLDSADSDWADNPYRVTLLSTGHAIDPNDTSRVVTHQIQAVVQLIPRNMPDEPSDWSTMQSYTVYQTKQDRFDLDIPCQITGKVRLQGQLRMAYHYPDGNGWWRYLDDLGRMVSAGSGDYRPLKGPVHLPYDRQDTWNLLALLYAINVSTSHYWGTTAASDWSRPTGLTTYQLYPGGPTYSVQEIGETLQNITLEPDVETNPVGIFYRDGSVTLRDNVTIRGTLICRETVTVAGTNVALKPADLPTLSGSTDPTRLCTVSCRNFTVAAAGSGSVVEGLVAVFGNFDVEQSADTVQFGLAGKLITQALYIHQREPWNVLDWDALYDAFVVQYYKPGGTSYFPVYMQKLGRSPVPLITIGPDDDTVTYHWHNWYDPIFVAHPDDATELDPEDPGLRWELIRWTDNPD